MIPLRRGNGIDAGASPAVAWWHAAGGLRRHGAGDTPPRRPAFRRSLPMTASPNLGAYCRAQLVPASLDFGVVAVGFPETVEARLINTGTAACTVTSWKIADCATDLEGGWVCPEPLQGDDSEYFEMVSGPSTSIGALGPKRPAL